MQIFVAISFVCMVIFPIRCSLEANGDALTAYEKRLAEFRRDFEKDTEAFENQEIGDVSPNLEDKDSSEIDRVDNTGSGHHTEEEMIKHLSDTTDRCCTVGKILAGHGLRCESNRFSKADRRVKLKLVNSTLTHLGISINEDNKQTLYSPFRICVLRNAREIDKCCLLNQNSKGGHNKKEHDFGIHSRRAKYERGHGSKHYRSRFESGEAMKGHGQFMKPVHGRKGYYGSGIHKDNYKWSRWAEFRSFRARNHRMTRHGSTARDPRDETF